MARTVNKVILLGRLGQDPELRYTGSGTAVCNMRLATDESYKNSEGEWVERTEWHNVVTWARLAEICGEYLQKGSQVYFEGNLQTRQWEDRDGNTRYSTEVKAREMVMLGERGGQNGGPQQQGQGAYSMNQSRSQGRPQQQRQQQSNDPSGGDAFQADDDLPF